jgi:hypothetical protein
MANRIIFQMDQATPSHKSILWTFRECGEIINLDRDKCICSPGHNQEKNENRNEPLHNFTGGKCVII